MRITKKLIDRAAELEALIAPLAAELDAIKTACKANGPGTYDGNRFALEVATSTTATLDTKLVKGLLTPAQIASCTKAGTRTTVKIREKVTTSIKVAA